jgi:hypothetical protein
MRWVVGVMLIGAGGMFVFFGALAIFGEFTQDQVSLGFTLFASGVIVLGIYLFRWGREWTSPVR